VGLCASFKHFERNQMKKRTDIRVVNICYAEHNEVWIVPVWLETTKAAHIVELTLASASDIEEHVKDFDADIAISNELVKLGFVQVSEEAEATIQADIDHPPIHFLSEVMAMYETLLCIPTTNGCINAPFVHDGKLETGFTQFEVGTPVVEVVEWLKSCNELFEPAMRMPTADDSEIDDAEASTAIVVLRHNTIEQVVCDQPLKFVCYDLDGGNLSINSGEAFYAPSVKFTCGEQAAPELILCTRIDSATVNSSLVEQIVAIVERDGAMVVRGEKLVDSDFAKSHYTCDQWLDLFEDLAIKNNEEFSGLGFETYGVDYEKVMQAYIQDPRRVWSIVDVEKDPRLTLDQEMGLRVTAGMNLDDAIAYYVLREDFVKAM
jgi:hypothetical protein